MNSESNVDDWLAELRSSWRAEEQAHAEVARRRLIDVPFSERLDAGQALRGLRLLEEEPIGEKVIAWMGGDRLTLRSFEGRTSEPVVLYVAEPEEEGAIHGVIARRHAERLGVLVRPDDLQHLEEHKFRLDLLDNPITFKRSHSIITRLIKERTSDETRLLECLAAIRAPVDSTSSARPYALFDTALNESQRRAVTHALNVSPVALIQGPPGTGKTRTAVEIVRQCIARGERVFVSAPSNLAVDNVCEGLDDAGVEVVRVGPVFRVTERVEDLTLEARIRAHSGWPSLVRWLKESHDRERKIETAVKKGWTTWAEVRDEQKEIRALRKDAEAQRRGIEDSILQQARVIASTPVGVPDFLALGEFDVVVVDEAAQCVTPMLLGALKAKRVILIGDHRQLPPTVIGTDDACRRLNATAFETIADAFPEACVMLNVQHRMHPLISAFPAERMYDGELHDAEALELRAFLPPDSEAHGLPTLVFVDAAGAGWDEDDRSESTSNSLMAERTAQEVRRLLRFGVPTGSISVITPYRAQRELLRELLDDTRVDIGTIDAFQGRENDVVVIDLVRSNEDGNIGFLAEIRRMNVAMTRARHHLVVVGDSATVGRNRFYSAWADHCLNGGNWRSVWEE
jgi:superfamily I DNA and/or RNA helicase